MSLTVYPHDSRPKLPVPLPNPPLPRLQGDGDPACPKCRGRGTVRKLYTAEELRALPPWEIPSTHFDNCECTKDRREREALERVWRKLSVVEPVPCSTLGQHVRRDLWIRTHASTLRAHLRRVLPEHPEILKGTRMITDADLLNAEFSWKKKADTQEGEDREVGYEVAGRRPIDLYGGRSLVILLVGIEEKKDWVTPGLVLTALRDRMNKSLPTWVVDSPEQPLQKGHLTFSDGIGWELAQWTKVVIDESGEREVDEFPAMEVQQVQQVQQVRQVAQTPRPTTQEVVAVAPVVEVHPVIRDAFGSIGVTDLTHAGGGSGEGRCVVPGCKGKLKGFLGNKDGSLIVGCSKTKHFGRAFVRFDRFKVELDKLTSKTAGEADDPQEDASRSTPSTPSTPVGKMEQKVIEWIQEHLKDGPRPLKMLDTFRQDDQISKTTFWRARQNPLFEDVDVEGKAGLRLKGWTRPSPTSTHQAGSPAPDHGAEIQSLLDTMK